MLCFWPPRFSSCTVPPRTFNLFFGSLLGHQSALIYFCDKCDLLNIKYLFCSYIFLIILCQIKNRCDQHALSKKPMCTVILPKIRFYQLMDKHWTWNFHWHNCKVRAILNIHVKIGGQKHSIMLCCLLPWLNNILGVLSKTQRMTKYF